MGISVQAGWLNSLRAANSQAMEQNRAGRAADSIDGGNLNLSADPIALRRKQAQAQAWNVVKNAWDNDKDIDGQIRNRKEHYSQMEKLRDEAYDGLTDVGNDKEALREFYDVDKDGQEQKDLELLEREKEMYAGLGGDFSEEEQKRLAELHSGTLTEYQQRALDMHDRAVNFKKQMRDAENEMKADTAMVRGIEEERRKHNPMLEAQQAADEIMDAANDEIEGMLVQEAVDHIDEVTEEAEEKAEEATEEKEEREEQMDEIALKRAIQKAMAEGTKEAVEEVRAAQRKNEAPDMDTNELTDIVKGDSQAEDVGQSLEEIKNSMKLVEADLKGIKVDEGV